MELGTRCGLMGVVAALLDPNLLSPPESRAVWGDDDDKDLRSAIWDMIGAVASGIGKIVVDISFRIIELHITKFLEPLASRK